MTQAFHEKARHLIDQSVWVSVPAKMSGARQPSKGVGGARPLKGFPDTFGLHRTKATLGENQLSVHSAPQSSQAQP